MDRWRLGGASGGQSLVEAAIWCLLITALVGASSRIFRSGYDAYRRVLASYPDPAG